MDIHEIFATRHKAINKIHELFHEHKTQRYDYV